MLAFMCPIFYLHPWCEKTMLVDTINLWCVDLLIYSYISCLQVWVCKTCECGPWTQACQMFTREMRPSFSFVLCCFTIIEIHHYNKFELDIYLIARCTWLLPLVGSGLNLIFVLFQFLFNSSFYMIVYVFSCDGCILSSGQLIIL